MLGFIDTVTDQGSLARVNRIILGCARYDGIGKRLGKPVKVTGVT